MKKNNEMKQKNPKRRKLAIILGVGLGSIAAAATATLLSSLSIFNQRKPVQTFSINFDAGEGGKIVEGKSSVSFTNATTLSNVEIPRVEKKYEKGGHENYYPFVEWRVSSTGETISYDQTITSSLNLTAVYADEYERQGLDYHTITFEKGDDSEVWLSGITRVACLSGRTLAQINKPIPHATNEDQRTFRGWALKGQENELIPLDVKITSDMVLVPIYVSTVKLTFNPGQDARIVSGQDSVAVEAGTLFGSINCPETAKTANDIFSAWYTEEPYGKSEEELETLKVNNNTSISNAMTVYAGYVQFDSAKYVKAHFIQNTTAKQPEVIYSGATTVALIRTKTWADCTRPVPTASGYAIKNWQVSLDYDKTTKQGTWSDLSDSSSVEFLGKDEVYFRPVMAANVTKVRLLGDSSMKQGQTKSYSAWAIPTSTQTAVEFKLYADEACATELDPSVATLTQTEEQVDECTVTVTNGTDATEFYLKGVSQIDKSVTDKKKISIISPLAEAADFMLFTTLGTASKNQWYKLDNLCDSSKNITAVSLNEINDKNAEVFTFERSSFNMEVYVGEGVRTIPDGFLNSCDSFNSKIHFASGTLNIGAGFLAKCRSFNTELDYSKIQNVGSQFLRSCTGFNQPISLSATVIEDGFLENCANFNSALNLGSNLKKIGSVVSGEFVSHFLQDCTSYNKDLLLPSSLTQVGDIFMNNVDEYTSNITLNCNPNYLPINYQNFSSISESAPIHKVGFTVSSATASYITAFLAKYPLIEQKGGYFYGSAYRKTYNMSEKDFINCSWSHLINKIEEYENAKITEEEFCRSFLIPKSGTSTKVVPESFADFLGLSKVVAWNGGNYGVKVVAYNHDSFELNGNLTKALFTFEFNRGLSASNGWPAFMPFDHRNGNKNTNYANSTLFAALSDTNPGTAAFPGLIWHGDKTTKAEIACGTSLYTLLSDANLKNHIKSCKRYYELFENGAWTSRTYNSKFAAPLISNIAPWVTGVDTNIPDEGKQSYQYYKDTTGYTSIYVKKDLRATSNRSDQNKNIKNYGYCSYYDFRVGSDWSPGHGTYVFYSSINTNATGANNAVWFNLGPNAKFGPGTQHGAYMISPVFAI